MDWQRSRLDAASKLRQLADAFRLANVDRITAQREADRSGVAPEVVSGEVTAGGINEALERVGLSARAKHYPAELSGGQQRAIPSRMFDYYASREMPAIGR